MEPLLNAYNYSIEKEFKFKKSDFEAASINSVYPSLWSERYSFCKISDIQFYISIYPNGMNDKSRGNAIISFIVSDIFHLNEKSKKDGEIKFSVDSANFSYKDKIKYNYSAGFQLPTSTFYDDFFVNGEMTLKVKGDLEITLLSRKTYPVSAQWKMKQSDLEALETSTTENGFLRSKRFRVFCYYDINFVISFYPRKTEESDGEQKEAAWVYLDMDFNKTFEGEAALTISIDSANLSKQFHHRFKKYTGHTQRHGILCCSTTDLFDPMKDYFIDGELVLKIEGLFMVERKGNSTILCLTKGFANRGMKRRKNKDFTIVIGEQRIEVHKDVLTSASPVFTGMLESGMKEALENQMSITDFEFEVVDAAIDLFYSYAIPKKFTFEQMLSLYQFAEKYLIQTIKEHVQNYLIEKLSPSNVCHLVNFSNTFNDTKLLSKCSEYLISCMRESKAVKDLDTLDNEFKLKLFNDAFVQTLETDASADAV